MIVAATALRPLVRKAWEATTFSSKHSISGSGRRGPKWFKGGSGGTGDSMRELKPGTSSSADPLQRQTSPSSWSDRIMSIAEEGSIGGGGDGGDISLSPIGRHDIVKTKRFSISSGRHQPASPGMPMELESGGGGIWVGPSRLLV